MAGRRDDRRVQFTKKLLRESMITHLRQKPVHKMTVTELCEGADINRGTFYSHFTDQYDLFVHTENTAIEEISRFIMAIPAENSEEGVKKACRNLYRYISEKEFLWRSLLGKNGNADICKKIIDLCYGDYLTKKGLTPETCDDATKLRYTFLLMGGIGMTKRWLEEEIDQTPDQLAVILAGFVLKPRN
ncbi:MAG: TetR family transcriptional regulator [Clostridiales bacterium]|nr:TetR family transcriptional regulator [Clostridiales bacterium]